MNKTNSILHNAKMILLTSIPTIVGIVLIIKGTITLPEWVGTVVAILTLIEHLLNGNTPNVQTPYISVSPDATDSTTPETSVQQV